MARMKKPLPLLESVEIEAVAAEGKCLFHWNDLVVFVPFCVPGDVCDVQIRRKKHSFAEGEVVHFIKYSNVRALPFCQHFGICGGCKWQNLPYEEQLHFKQQQVYDQLTRIGKVALPEFRPILGSAKTREYRNKLDFGCANKRWLSNEELRMKNEEFATAEGVKATSAGANSSLFTLHSSLNAAVANSTRSTLNSKLKDAAVANSQFSTLNSQLTQKIIPGLIVTGDWFVDSKEKMREIVGHFPEAKAVDMESCAIAQTCYINKVPFISFRIISDIPLRDTNASQYHNFWENMAERSFQVTKRFVESLL